MATGNACDGSRASCRQTTMEYSLDDDEDSESNEVIMHMFENSNDALGFESIGLSNTFQPIKPAPLGVTVAYGSMESKVLYYA